MVVLVVPYPALPAIIAERAASLAGKIVVDITNPLNFETFDSLTTTVLIAGDDADAKSTLAGVVTSGGLKAIDAGSLKRARELEGFGFLQLSLAAGEKTSWTGGFAAVA